MLDAFHYYANACNGSVHLNMQVTLINSVVMHHHSIQFRLLIYMMGHTTEFVLCNTIALIRNYPWSARCATV